MPDQNVSSLFKPRQKTAVITGGTRGLGLYAASGLLLAGVQRIIITSRKAKACEDAKLYLKKLRPHAEIIAIPSDLSKFEEVERFVKEVDGIVGPEGVGILIANAGATWGEAFETHPDSAFAKVMDLNVRSVFNIIRLMTPLLERASTKENPGRVITVGSVAGINIGAVKSPNATPGYSASKAAVIHLTKNLAIELGSRHILSNCIAPGFFPSKMANGLIDAAGGIEALGEANPNGRLGIPEDIVGAVVFLCSKASEHINGDVLIIDGGNHLDRARI